ncbi:hypothetical protein yc1106_06878 [Curvularia clavata]|uniref:Dynamin GTPase domain-containing protein n=1 Tax=Curvularia clavata TaxID=95742 RepID=A0A9Q8ZBJ1_CURCL|nr:hypothetical protein yc1106_06878 [Curvularia clavata]
MPPAARRGKRENISHLSEDHRPVDQVAVITPDKQRDSSEAPDTDALGRHVNEVIKTISRLQSLGLQRLKIPLPKCIVLGEQSAGKSSVIEAISGIKTPRSDDTCTRCPLFISLEGSEDPRARWNASVSLRLDYKHDGNNGRDRRFRGWCPLPQPTIVPFATTENPNELEHFIARAQLTVLSPHIDHEVFLRPSLAGLREDGRCAFSPNVVCISIAQPGLPALSFYDLPGIIGQAEIEEDQFVVKFVSDLVTDYVKDPETLVLLCCSLETDIANSTAGGIARKLKATDRCIGVLTKPDRLPPGSRHDKLMEVFEQKRFALGHGYFVVKNLGQDEINQGLTHQEARAREREFFDKDQIWSTTFKIYAHRFGTVNLQRFLSQKLAEHIMKKLPIIEQEIDTRLHEVENALQQFPEPPTHNATRIISDVIFDFSQEVRREIEAQWPCKTWRNNWKALQRSFFDALANMKPGLVIRGKEDESVYWDIQAALPGGSAKEPIPLSDSENEGNEEDDAVSETVKGSSESPTKKRKLDDIANISGERGPPAPLDGATGMQFADFSNLKKSFRLDDVRQHLMENSQSKIPGQIEPRVINSMMLEAIEHWRKPLDQFFDILRTQIRDQIHDVFEKYFRSREGSAFYVETWKIVDDMLANDLLQPNMNMALDSLKDEKEGPYIFHKDVFEEEKKKSLDYYQQHRLVNRLSLYKRTKEQRTKKPMTPAEEEKVKKHCMAVLKFEPYEVEVGVVAQVTTYYMLAARRFHDSVCMRIESHWYKKLATELRDELENRLGVRHDQQGHDNAVRLLAEPSHRYNQRKELIGQRNSLVEGQKVLKDLQKKYGIGAPVAAKVEDVGNA